MEQILVSGAHWAKYDDDVHPFLAGRRWRLRVFGHNHYAVTTVGGREVSMHRLVMAATRGTVVDHIDGDGLNNQRANLRFCTRAENFQNAGWRNTPGRTARFKGVWRVKGKCRRCWRAGITARRRYKNIGSFWTEEAAAAHAYDAEARVLHGQFARLNYPDAE